MNDKRGSTAPLSGYRVLELGTTVAGPFCARLLADFGAEVIKVEPREGDPVRDMGASMDGVSLYAASILRNKRVICVDMRRSEGRALVKRLAIASDAIVENFRPGTLEKWGLGYEDLAPENPRLVLVRISGYGQTGPYHTRPGYGVVCEAMSGIRDLTGDPDRPPGRVGVALTDCVAALYAAFGCVTALLHSRKTGRGQCVDTALYEAAFSFMEPHVPAFAALGLIPQRAGSSLPLHAPNNLYPTRDQRYIHIAAGTTAIFGRFATAIGRTDLLEDPRFATAVARKTNAAALDKIIATWTLSVSLEQANETLLAAEVPAAPIYTISDIFADPQYRARSMLVNMPEPTLGLVTVPGIVPKLSETPGALRWAGHGLGEDTASVLSEILGLSEAEITRLQNEDVILCGAAPPTLKTSSS